MEKISNDVVIALFNISTGWKDKMSILSTLSILSTYVQYVYVYIYICMYCLELCTRAMNNIALQLSTIQISI